MSVQAGVWNFDGSPADPKQIEDMSDFSKRQGRDGNSRYVDGSVALLYHPFHTTAESRREKQPHLSRRGFVLTWDGRLDDRELLIADLHSNLEAEPTDIDIVAAAFDRWETDSFRHLIGDWAVSIWKPQQRELLFASDYMGVRHIFYSLKRDRIFWSTDLSSLVLRLNERFHLDDEYIAGYLAHNPDGHLTAFREIRQVPPGQFVLIRNCNALIERFWRFSPRSRIRYKTDAEYEEHFRHVFRQSVRRRLRSDAPILAELSGGLDSSSIVCMADDILAKEGAETSRLDTLSYYDQSEPSADDEIYSRKVEKKRRRMGIHIDASGIASSPASLACSEFCALPGDLGAAAGIGRERSEAILAGGYRAVLSGLGGDEFMGGIPDPRGHLADLVVQFRFIRLFKELIAWGLLKRRPWTKLLWQSVVDALPSSLGQYFAAEAKIAPWIRKDFAKRTRLAIRQIDTAEHFGLWLPTRRSQIAGMLTMANNLAKTAPATAFEETRYPFLDQSLIEFILSIPANQLLRPGERRSLMRRSLVGIVPDEILSRRTKQLGTRTPVLVLEKHSDELKKVCMDSLSSSFGYVYDDRLLTVIDDARAGKTVPLVRLLWTISLEFWLREIAGRGLLDASANSTSLARQLGLATITYR
jgi:asparagine synthase (glutamine-hydrolysing)